MSFHINTLPCMFSRITCSYFGFFCVGGSCSALRRHSSVFVCWVMFYIFTLFLVWFPFMCNLLFALVLVCSFSSCLLCFSFFLAICWTISFYSFGFVLRSCCLLFTTFCCQDYVWSFVLFVQLLRSVVYGFQSLFAGLLIDF